MSIHLILGRQGSGKTLFLVKIALENWKEKKYANFHLNIPYSKIKYKNIINCKMINCKTFIDEIHLLLPARASLSKTNREICDNFLSMARKQNNDIYGTTQTARKVDIRFREEADFIYYCTKFVWRNNQWIEVLHDNMINKDEKVIISIEVEDAITGNLVKTAFIGNKYYDYYDTSEIIKVEGLEEALSKKKKKRK